MKMPARSSFEGRRRGILPVPLRLCDLSVGACLIESRSPEDRGRRLEIETTCVGR